MADGGPTGSDPSGRRDADEEQLVQAAVDELLAACDPRAVEPRQFFGEQFDRGLARVDFPRGLGGLEVSARWQASVDRRLRAAGAKSAVIRNPLGAGMGLPTLRTHGTLEQLRRYARPCFTSAEIWCQLFSEPGSGSDLAGLATRATFDGGCWTVNGQKLWTSLGHIASIGMLLARTDPDAPKHAGLTFFLLDMHQPGVEVRPVRDMTGDTKFNEVFLTDVRIPDSARVGACGDGWRVATTTLLNERAVLAGAGASGPDNIGGAGIDRLLTTAASAPAGTSPVVVDHLMRCWIRSKVIKLTNQRMAAQRRAGAATLNGSVTKLMQGLHNRDMQELAMHVGGLDSQAWQTADGERTAKGFLRAQSNTIAGGTSNILRNTIGERLLGLPREPGPGPDTPWSSLPRNG